ncbi:hypothetical protein CL6EHI_023000 [Entamoeba histolytica]|uniref:Uncharacterized protein n=3 Tax=Entamoeba histolytica TaxID=5759 RepID=B1N2M1_ENTH1|nr:hypothetical protein EHI_023000 [Entamoeba histolytica HM-1:IMSS]EDS89788.1 hypothetical protein EHI_023000 [Entamoeba histolytica HM-1:IMSS]EMD48964.1 Hypothetical protein EHI5A_274950 [Entamoeba histolytica KU27]GAT92311.1 hypothetical protein CL6EHI_023000 [Entamoeba histolytica]|eukprot:XP_001913437.1 hypothetical protein EHI_023000 [Entamoeba histolytica HM-1:IMSS]
MSHSPDPKYEHQSQRTEKLSKITGRHASIDKIEPFLVASTEEEAIKNGQLIRKSDQIKKMSGCRPLAYQVDDEKGENNKKINVLKKKFGDDHNVHGVIPYVLNVDSEEDAAEKGKQLRSYEKVQRKMGQL